MAYLVPLPVQFLLLANFRKKAAQALRVLLMRQVRLVLQEQLAALLLLGMQVMTELVLAVNFESEQQGRPL